MIERAAKVTARMSPTVLAALIIAATIGLLLLLGAAPADVAADPTGGASISVEAPALG